MSQDPDDRSSARRLWDLERLEARLKRRMEQDRARRAKLRENILSTRMRLTADEADEYSVLLLRGEMARRTGGLTEKEKRVAVRATYFGRAWTGRGPVGRRRF